MTQRCLQVADAMIAYEVRTSRRASRLRLTVYRGGSVILTIPRGTDTKEAQFFLDQKKAWLVQTLARLHQPDDSELRLPALPQFEEGRDRALILVRKRLTHFNQTYGFSFHRISIKRTKTLWGSCSQNGNLSFHYRIISLPPALADYLIVHELCHLGEFSHSPKFWSLVGQTIPDYPSRRRELKRLSLL